MWSAMKDALDGKALEPVAWNALWAKQKGLNDTMVEWDLKAMIKKAKRNAPKQPPSMFAKL